MSVIDTGVVTPLEKGVVDAQNPWPGLLAFREADQAYFQGRRAETEELLRLVMRERFTVLFGLSGLGKSSLLRAGVFPLLRNESVFPVYVRLDYLPSGSDLVSQVKEAIAREAAAAEIEIPAARAGETLWEYFHRHDADFWNRRNRPVVPLLVFDQFEEIFTLGQADAARAAASELLIEQLADLAEGRTPVAVETRLNQNPHEAEQFVFGSHRYKVLLGIREDFLPELEGLRPRISSIAVNRMRLRRMNGEAALLAVNQAPHLISEAVAERVVRFVAKEMQAVAPLANLEVEPALLSIICRGLNNERQLRREPMITLELLEDNQEEVLTVFYKDSFEGVPPAVSTFVEERLLTVSGYRDSVALDNALSTPGVTRAAIDLLVERRLVRVEDRGGERLELTHDRLTEVAKASRERRREAEEGEKQATARSEAEEREKQQRAAHEEQRNRKIRFYSLLAAVAFVVLGLFTVYAFQQTIKAERQSREAGNQRQIAVAQATEAIAQKKIADSKTKEAKTAALRAAASEKEALHQKAIADQERAKAVALAAAAEKARRNEEMAKLEQTRLANLARESAESAEARRVDADEQRNLAKKESAKAERQEGLAVQAQKRLEKTLAQADVLEAVRLVEVGADRRPEALAYLARALRNDPASMAAQSFAFDLLSLGIPATSNVSGAAELTPLAKLSHGEAGVLFAAYSRDGRRMVTATSDNLAHIWDPKLPNQPICELAGHRGLVNSAVFSRDGLQVVTASQDKTARIWETAGCKPVRELTGHTGPVTSASFHKDGNQVVTSSWDRTARIWNAVTGEMVRELTGHTGPLTSAAFSPDGARVVTASWDKTARVWDWAQGKSEPPLMHKDQVNSAAFSPDGKRVVTASEDNTARVWEGIRLIGTPLRHKKGVNAAAFSPDGKRVVTASDDGTARVWEADTGTPISLTMPHPERVSAAAFHREGLEVATSSYDGTTRIWEVRSHVRDAAYLAELAEAASGYQVDRLPNLVPLPDAEARLNKLSTPASGQDLKSWVRGLYVRPK